MEENLVSLTSEESLKHITLDLMQMQEFIKKPLIMAKADGVWYEDIHGKRYLDGISGIFVATIGHNNSRVKKAIREQIEKITFAPPLHATNLAAIQLANLIAKITPGDLNTIKLFSGGSEATEAAMKLARQYHRQTGNPNKYKVIAMYKGFHGTTMGALSATGTKKRKVMFEPTLTGFIHTFPPLCFRCPYEKKYSQCNIFCARTIEKIIDLEGSESVSALIIEPIGNTGGIVTPPDEYLPTLRRICDKHNVILIFDEIITGFGRTGNMFAAQTFNTTPDVLCMGKGMGSGYSPLAGIAYKDKIADAFWGKGEDHVEFSEGHTFGGNPLSSAAGIACISELLDKNLCQRARELGEYLQNKLRELSNNLGIFGNIRGKGLLIGVEFVKNTSTNEPFDENVEFGIQVGKTAMEKGLILRYDPDWVAFAPPLIITKEEIDQMVDIFGESIKEVLKTEPLC